jgi:hypothetical protein
MVTVLDKAGMHPEEEEVMQGRVQHEALKIYKGFKWSSEELVKQARVLNDLTTHTRDLCFMP